MLNLMPEDLLSPLQPGSGALAPFFRANLNDDMLGVIAEADYGEGAGRCHQMLRLMLAKGAAAPDNSQLREVLQLISYSQPETADWQPGITGPSGHWIRLFSCHALLQLDEALLKGRSEDYTLAAFVDSALQLGNPVAQAAASVLAARFLRHPGNNSAYLALAIVLLAAHLERRPAKGTWLHRLANWLEEEELKAHWWDSEELWLFGPVTPLSHGKWRQLAHTILVAPKRHLPEADKALRRIGARLDVDRSGVDARRFMP